MTPAEWTLLPIGVSIVAILAFIPAAGMTWLIASLGLILSFVQCFDNMFGQLILIASLAVVLCSRRQPGEFHILLLSSTLGALVCTQARDFITLFVGIELLSLPIYGLIGFDSKNAKNLTAAIKYLVLAGTSSAFMLMGIVFLYAETGSMALHFTGPLGSCLFLAGICFKLSLAPFHLWTPDVYNDAPLPVTAFLATVSKIAFVSILMQFSPSPKLMPVLMAVAVLSMLVGSILTLKADKMARFLAYSSIAHMGYVMVAWMTHSNIAFYMAAYTVSLLVIFCALMLDFEKIAILGLLSLMGIPMTPIFWAKYQVLISAFAAHQPVLFGVFIVSSFISVYGYGRVIARICQRTKLS
ncbi:MAG: proton-conducting transporter membrane subunit [Myxococcota bacterium]